MINAGGWRDWLTDALSFLAAKDDAEPVEGAHGDGSAA